MTWTSGDPDPATDAEPLGTGSRHRLCAAARAGEKAFCAGGDIRSFYYRKQEASGSELFEYARDFFEQEYRLDHHIHSYRKPLICVADGICMGGGIGLFAGADFRVVTERSLFAMPEVTIGLYPTWGRAGF